MYDKIHYNKKNNNNLKKEKPSQVFLSDYSSLSPTPYLQEPTIPPLKVFFSFTLFALYNLHTLSHLFLGAQF